MTRIILGVTLGLLLGGAVTIGAGQVLAPPCAPTWILWVYNAYGEKEQGWKLPSEAYSIQKDCEAVAAWKSKMAGRNLFGCFPDTFNPKQ
jgi:hypothetical protein